MKKSNILRFVRAFATALIIVGAAGFCGGCGHTGVLFADGADEGYEDFEISVDGDLKAPASDTTDAGDTDVLADGSDAGSGVCVIYVEVAGAVNNPGVYTFSTGDRVFQAIEAAGGFTYDAYTEAINQAQPLNDADKITVLTKKQAKKLEKEGQSIDGDGAPTASDIADSASGLIDINSADKEELLTLPGIGDTKASAIIAYRQEHGSFSSVERITDVPGIGESTYNNLKSLICAR